MELPPTREDYEKLLNEVKALREENKRLLNAKQTNRPAVGIDTTSNHHKVRRQESIWTFHKVKTLLGHDVEMDEGLDWRLKWG